MFTIVYLFGTYVANLFKSRRRLEVENLFLRHQVNIVLRRAPQRLRLRGSDRALLVWMTRVWLIGAGNPKVGREGPGFSVSYVISSGVCARRTRCGAPRESMASC
jgi:hypothetical protein